MYPAYINDSEAEAEASGGLLDWLKAGTELFRVIREDGRTTNTGVVPPVPRPPQAAPVPWYKQPMVWAGAAVLLLVGVLIVRSK